MRDSDATLILAFGPLQGGTRRTLEVAELFRKPYWVANPARPDLLWRVRQWLGSHPLGILNVAGPRESEEPGIYNAALCFVHALLQA